MNRLQIKQELIEDEGYREMPYEDSVGKVTIGIGRNLSDNGVSSGEIDLMFKNDLADAIKDAVRWFPQLYELGQVRQHVIVNMMFNMGYPTMETFQKFKRALELRNFDAAAEEMLNSKWATQVGKRAERLAYEMKYGRKDG